MGIGGVLSQVQDGSKRVVAYFSKTLSKAQRIYCVTCRELLAIVKTLVHFHKYLHGQEFYLSPNHSALTWLLSFRNLEGKTARWVQHLQEYNYTSETPSRHQAHQHRHPFQVPCPEECSHCRQVEQQADGQRVRIVAVAAANGWDQQTLRREQLADNIGPLMLEMEAGQCPKQRGISAWGPIYKSYWAQWKTLAVRDGMLQHHWESADKKKMAAQIVIPLSKMREVL